MDILKNQGLNQATYQLCKKSLAKLPNRRMKKRLQAWLDEHIRLQCRLGIGQTPLPVSTDAIESLMGSTKSIIERNPIPEFGKLSLAVPLLCGKPSTTQVASDLTKCSHKKYDKWLKENLGSTIRKQKIRLQTELRAEVGSKMQFG